VQDFGRAEGKEKGGKFINLLLEIKYREDREE
jgi:hypothetical protein